MSGVDKGMYWIDGTINILNVERYIDISIALLLSHVLFIFTIYIMNKIYF